MRIINPTLDREFENCYQSIHSQYKNERNSLLLQAADEWDRYRETTIKIQNKRNEIIDTYQKDCRKKILAIPYPSKMKNGEYYGPDRNNPDYMALFTPIVRDSNEKTEHCRMEAKSALDKVGHACFKKCNELKDEISEKKQEAKDNAQSKCEVILRENSFSDEDIIIYLKRIADHFDSLFAPQYQLFEENAIFTPGATHNLRQQLSGD